MKERVKLRGYRIKEAVFLSITGLFLLLSPVPGYPENEVPVQGEGQETPDSEIPYREHKGKGRVSVVEKDGTGGRQVKTIRLNTDRLKSDNWLLEQYSKTSGSPLPGTKIDVLAAEEDVDDGVYGELTQKEAVKEEKRDPFMPSGLMQEKNKALVRNKEQKNVVAGDGMVFVPSDLPGKMPKMSLRGHIRDDSNRVIALIDIEGGGLHMVTEGDTIGLQDMGYDTFIRIKKIGRRHLVVESGALGKLFIVR